MKVAICGTVRAGMPNQLIAKAVKASGWNVTKLAVLHGADIKGIGPEAEVWATLNKIAVERIELEPMLPDPALSIPQANHRLVASVSHMIVIHGYDCVWAGHVANAARNAAANKAFPFHLYEHITL